MTVKKKKTIVRRKLQGMLDSRTLYKTSLPRIEVTLDEGGWIVGAVDLNDAIDFGGDVMIWVARNV